MGSGVLRYQPKRKRYLRDPVFGYWKRWAEDNGEAPGSSKSFSQTMIRAGFEPMKHTPGHHGKRGSWDCA